MWVDPNVIRVQSANHYTMEPHIGPQCNQLKALEQRLRFPEEEILPPEHRNSA